MKASDVTVATLRMRGVDTELVKRAQHGDREAFGLLAADLATRFRFGEDAHENAERVLPARPRRGGRDATAPVLVAGVEVPTV